MIRYSITTVTLSFSDTSHSDMIQSVKIPVFLFFLIFQQISGPVAFGYDGFLRASGKFIIDGKGQPVLLRGMGLGGWMLQEGYMLETADFAGTQHEIKARIQDVAGKAGMEKFYDAWLANHVTRRDIDSMAAWGFNSVRPALHYNLFTLPIEQEPVTGQQTWIDKGFILLDSLVSWCSANRMYVFLDLHAAPGGQGRDNNISDRDPSKPSLWESSDNRTKTIELWRKLAERYAGNPWVGGYDLINETNWDFENSGNQSGCNCGRNAPLLDLYQNIITAIRSKDPNHMIFIEGNCWAGNFNGLTSLTSFDNNLAFSFHRYWNGNTIASIQEKLNLRDTYNVPLWMGESGENSNHWFAEAISLLESNNIGWSWWPEKKINSVVGPMTVIKTKEYDKILTFWRSGGARPDSSFAAAALMQIAENLKIENCIIHPDVMDAMFRQQLTNATKPFSRNLVPGRFYAVDFDMGRNNYAYADKDFENSGGQASNEWNRGYVYRNDGPDIVRCTDSAAFSNGYNIDNTEKDEWLAYTIIADSTGVYNLNITTAAASGMGTFRIEIDGINVTGSVAVPHTGGVQRFSSVSMKNIELTAGLHKMILYFEEGGFSVSSFTFTGPTGATGVPFCLLSGKTDDLGNQVILTFNKPLSGYPSTGANLTLSAGDKTYIPESVTFEPANPRSVRLRFSVIFSGSDILRISCSGSIFTSGAEVLPAFTDVPVVNVIMQRFAIPGSIEAENYLVNSGFGFEQCTDIGGGKDAGWSDPGDYLEFPVRIAEKALYRITYRYSCNTGAAKAAIYLVDEVMRLVQTVDFPATGGWQNWNSVTVSDTLPAGPKTLRFTAITGGFNLNRIEFVKVPPKDTILVSKAGFILYPNPANGSVTVQITNPGGNPQQLVLTDLLGRVIYKRDTPATSTAKLNIDTTGCLPGIYLLSVGDKQSLETHLLLIKNMNL